MNNDDDSMFEVQKSVDGGVTVFGKEKNNQQPAVHIGPIKEDGTAVITIAGEQYTLSQKEIKQLMKEAKEADSENEFAVLGFLQTEKSYDTVKDLMQEPEERKKLLNAFKFMCDYFKDGSWDGRPNAGTDLLETIIGYPKVLAENQLPTSMVGVTNKDIHNAFIEEDAIKLPFPRIAVVVGKYTGNHDFDVPQIVSIEKDITRINTLTCYFLMQVENKIRLEYILGTRELADNDPHSKLKIASFMVYVRDGGIRIAAAPNEASMFLMNQFSQQNLDEVLQLIYLMTHPGGDFMMSVPTPDDIVINKKRLHKNKKPLIEFKLITIDGKKKDTLPSIPIGTHASPRQHWRRGHYRHYSSGKTVFIDPMLVGDEKNGKIIKDYAVGAYEDRGHERGGSHPA
jgi:hypothetical protein